MSFQQPGGGASAQPVLYLILISLWGVKYGPGERAAPQPHSSGFNLPSSFWMWLRGHSFPDTVEEGGGARVVALGAEFVFESASMCICLGTESGTRYGTH